MPSPDRDPDWHAWRPWLVAFVIASAAGIAALVDGRWRTFLIGLIAVLLVASAALLIWSLKPVRVVWGNIVAKYKRRKAERRARKPRMSIQTYTHIDPVRLQIWLDWPTGTLPQDRRTGRRSVEGLPPVSCQVTRLGEGQSWLVTVPLESMVVRNVGCSVGFPVDFPAARDMDLPIPPGRYEVVWLQRGATVARRTVKVGEWMGLVPPRRRQFRAWLGRWSSSDPA